MSGQKTQTRRIIKGCDVDAKEFEKPEVIQYLIKAHAEYKVGEVAYIREGFRFPKDFDIKKPSEVEASPVEYRIGGSLNCIGDHIKNPGKWRSPLHLPSKFARHFVIVTEVRVERLRAITNADAFSEGVELIKENGCPRFKMYGHTNSTTISPKASFSTMFHFNSTLLNPRLIKRIGCFTPSTNWYKYAPIP